MIIRFEVDCFGYSVGGYCKTFEIEFEEDEFEGMDKYEKNYYIHEQIMKHIEENIEIHYYE